MYFSDSMNSAVASSVPTLQISMPSEASSSVIHSPNSSQEELLSDEEAKKRRELLARRPSYRKILSDLSDVEKDLKQEPEMGEGEGGGGRREGGPNPMALPPHQSNPIPHTSSDNPNFPGMPLAGMNGEMGMGGLAPPNLMGFGGGADQQPGSSQLLVSVNSDILGLRPVGVGSPLSVSVSSGLGPMGNMSAGSSMGYSPGSAHSPTLSHKGMDDGPIGGTGPEAVRKRQLRLLKNREAAKECRRKKKEYVKCLENRVAVLENQNKALIEELKTLKELYCRKGD